MPNRCCQITDVPLPTDSVNTLFVVMHASRWCWFLWHIQEQLCIGIWAGLDVDAKWDWYVLHHVLLEAHKHNWSYIIVHSYPMKLLAKSIRVGHNCNCKIEKRFNVGYSYVISTKKAILGRYGCLFICKSLHVISRPKANPWSALSVMLLGTLCFCN